MSPKPSDHPFIFKLKQMGGSVIGTAASSGVAGWIGKEGGGGGVAGGLRGGGGETL